MRNRGFAKSKAEKEKRKEDIRNCRRQAETPFAKIKNIFTMLSGGPHHSWREDFDQLDATVEWAVGVVNAQIEFEPDFE